METKERPMHWLASAAALLGLCCPTVARAQVQTMSDGIPIVIEAHLGWNEPLGIYGLALVYDRGGTFSGGLGVGLNSLKGDTLPPLGLFGRARLLRWGWGSLGVGAALSRDHYSSDQGDDGVWYWNPSYRATGTAAAELTNRRWSLRFEAGLGYLLNSYSECGPSFTSGSCNSPPGRLVPSLTAAVGYRFGVSDAYIAAAEGEFEYKSPSTAFGLSALSTVVPVMAGAIMFGFAPKYDDTLAITGLVSMGFGLSLGPTIGYAYAGEQLRGWGLGLLRAAGIGLGSVAIFAAGISSSCDDCTHSSSASEAEALGIVLITAALVSAVYDVVTAPNAARRANTRHGLTNLSLVPVPIPGRASTSPGLSLIGQF